MNALAEQAERSQRITVAEIVALLANDTDLSRVRTALMLAYNRGYSAGLDAAQSIFAPQSNG